jgi:carboxylesterase
MAKALVPQIDGYLHRPSPSGFEEWIGQIHNTIDDAKNRYKNHKLSCKSALGSTLALAVASQRTDIPSIALLLPVCVTGWSVPRYRFLLDIAYKLGISDWRYLEQEPFGIKNQDLRRRIRDKFKANELSEVGAPFRARHLHEAKGLMSYVTNNLDAIS